MSRQVVFRGFSIEVTSSRVRDRRSDRFYYELRQPDDRWGSPATLEEKVSVNFCGTVISREKIDVGVDDYLELTDAEMRELISNLEDDDEGSPTSATG